MAIGPQRFAEETAQSLDGLFSVGLTIATSRSKLAFFFAWSLRAMPQTAAMRSDKGGCGVDSDRTSEEGGHDTVRDCSPGGF
jgi:hypothetical protein